MLGLFIDWVNSAKGAEQSNSSGDVDAFAVAKASLDAFEFHETIGEGKQGVVFSLANVDAGQDGCAALANQDGSSGDGFTAEGLDAKPFGIGIAAVSCGACAFLMSHGEEMEDGGLKVRSV